MNESNKGCSYPDCKDFWYVDRHTNCTGCCVRLVVVAENGWNEAKNGLDGCTSVRSSGNDGPENAQDPLREERPSFSFLRTTAKAVNILN